MAQADDIKALQGQVADLTQGLEASVTLATDLVKRLETLENAEPIQGEELVAVTADDGSKFAALEDRIEKIRAFVNAPS